MEICSGLPVLIYLDKGPLNSAMAMKGKRQKPALTGLEPKLAPSTIRESNFGQRYEFYCGRQLVQVFRHDDLVTARDFPAWVYIMCKAYIFWLECATNRYKFWSQ